jgi:hypothetical protein
MIIKVFADADILVSVLNKELPLFSFTSRILSLAGHPHFRIYTSPACLAVAFYFAQKKHGNAAKARLELLCRHIETAEVTRGCILSALADPKVHDLGDGLEYYAALEAGCHCIVTENKKDFYFSKIEILNSLEFYGKYMAPKKQPNR